jgi:hypothetical protein
MLNETLHECQKTSGREGRHLEVVRTRERRQRRQRMLERAARRNIEGWTGRMF